MVIAVSFLTIVIGTAIRQSIIILFPPILSEFGWSRPLLVPLYPALVANLSLLWDSHLYRGEHSSHPAPYDYRLQLVRQTERNSYRYHNQRRKWDSTPMSRSVRRRLRTPLRRHQNRLRLR